MVPVILSAPVSVSFPL